MSSTDNPVYALSPSELRAAARQSDAVRVFRLILFCSQRLRTLFDEHLRQSGLTTQQGVMLSVVRTKDRPTLGEAARAMATSHQNAKQIALVLERKGMVRIVTDAKDRRIRRLEATAAGRRGWQSRNAGDFATIGAWFAGLSRQDQKALRQLLERLAPLLGP